ncbi:GMC family oxidoreductase [Virgibacillus sp. NKC19-3]|uniref:GMC family oxidoreductase n=1 Tax=Virgibacillus saliphilus TaxID=2831674 RepID=UPI001C9B9DF2|nr:GMC family oxidoreductase [Virgibacillus sp. NKC19-3]MBY7144499.1 GMC family oxidoreductase [Virgibacillus sp. NKC19-3]
MAIKLDKTDAVIVGTGWAGGIAAAELTKQGYKVVALERGEDISSEDFIGSKDELKYEVRHDLYQDRTKETITTRNTTDEDAKPLRDQPTDTNGDGTGGTSTHWAGWTFRFLPFDFEIRSKIEEKYGEDRIPEDMSIQDWGIIYDELEPYYDKFEKTAGISGEENPLGPERSDDYPNPPMKETPSIRMFKEAAEALGYHPYRTPSANMSQQYENPDGETINACVYCSFCEMYGCDFGAKADPIVTVLKTAKKTDNFEIRNHAYVTRVLHDDDKASGVLYVDTQTGEEYEQPADIVVVAAYTYGNTRLMLLSEIGEPYNPETGEGIIGKNITAHYGNLLFTGVDGFFEDKKFNSFAGTGALGATLDDYNGHQIDNNETDFLHGFQLNISQGGAEPISNNPVPKDTPSWGKEFKENSLYYTNRHLGVGSMEACLPREHNFMDLDPRYNDIFGDPLLRLTVKFTDQERNLAKYKIEKAKEIMEEMGADIVEAPEITDETEFNQDSIHSHTTGGVIMGDSPETSAVNNYSQMWEKENLFVVGGSSFPHIGAYNPTGTIGALAYRATEGMVEYLEGDGGLLIEPKEEDKA